MKGLSIWGVLALTASLTASAATISYSDLTVGQSSVVVGGVTVSAYSNSGSNTAGTFATKTVGGITGAGVDGNGNQEIDLFVGGSESIRFIFPDAVTVTRLDLVFLYPQGEFDDSVNEVARVRVNGTTDYFLTATGITTATWSGTGGVANLALAQDGNPGPEGGGWWKIGDSIASIFGANAITSLELMPYSAQGSVIPDFSFKKLVWEESDNPQEIPEPATTSMLACGLGALALGAWRRGKR